MTTTITAGELRIAITAVKPCTDNPPAAGGALWRDTLGAICLEAGGGLLHATATDTYAMAQASRPAEGPLDPIYLAPDAIETVLAALSKLGDETPVCLTPADGQLEMSTEHPDLERLLVPRSEPWDGFIWSALTRVFGECASVEDCSLDLPLGIGPTYLRAVAGAADLDDGYEGTPGGTARVRVYAAGWDQPVRFEIGTWALFLVKPVASNTETGKGPDMAPNIPLYRPATSDVPAV
jgi:hypothetical protein